MALADQYAITTSASSTPPSTASPAAPAGCQAGPGWDPV